MKRYFPCLILSGLVFLVYGNTFLNSFHFDDINAILQKPWIRGLDKIPQFIFSFGQRPLLILTFNLNYAIGEFDVWSYHLFNIVGHLGVTLLVYRLVVLMGEFNHSDRHTRPMSAVPFLAALIFALHPLNTQSVTYLSSRSAILATLFYLATLVILIQGFWETKNWRKWLWFSGSFISLVCGFLSKEIIMTFPAMAFLFHFYFMSRLSFGQWLVQQLKWIVLAGVVLGAGILYKYTHGGLLPTSPTDYSSATYFLTQTFVIPLQYFRKMFFPINLSIDIHFPVYSDWLGISSHTGIVLLLAIVGVLIFVSRAQPMMGFGLAWALITILPESSFVPLLDMAVEHRTYLPLAGFSIFAAGVLCQLTQGMKTARYLAAWSAVILILLFFAAGLIQRNTVWKDELSLWTDAARKAPNLIRPHNNMAEAYDKLEQYDKAIAGFETTLKIDPNYVFGLSNLGNIYGKKEEYRKAIEYFEKALAVKPDYAPAHYNLAKAFHKLGQPQKALEHYRNAIHDNPYFEEAYYNLAFLAAEAGLHDEAIRNFLHFLEGQPKNTRAHFGLGNAYFQNKQLDLALAEYQKAIAVDPSYIFPYINTATIYMQTGKIEEAVATYNKILAIRPGIAGVHKNLGMIYYQSKNDPRQALHHFEESLRLDPTQPEAAIIQKTIVDLKKEVEALR